VGAALDPAWQQVALLYSGRPRAERARPADRRSTIARLGRIVRPVRRSSGRPPAVRRSIGTAPRERS